MTALLRRKNSRTTLYGPKRKQLTIHIPTAYSALGVLGGRVRYARPLVSGDRVDPDLGTLTSKQGKVERILVDWAGVRSENIRSFFVWPPRVTLVRLESAYARYLERANRFLTARYQPIFNKVVAAEQVRIRCSKSPHPCGTKSCFWELKDEGDPAVVFRAHEIKPRGTREVNPGLHRAFYQAQDRVAAHNGTVQAMRYILGPMLAKALPLPRIHEQVGWVHVGGRAYLFRTHEGRFGFEWKLVFWPASEDEIVVQVTDNE